MTFDDLGSYSRSGKASYHKILWNLEATGLGVIMIVLLWNLTAAKVLVKFES